MTKTTYKQIDLAGWTKVGEGGNGSVYTCPEQPGVILKVSNYTAEDGATETLADEFTHSKAVFDLGLPTPEMKEMVRVGENEGIICEAIANKKSFARISGETPERIDRLAERMAKLAKQFHSTNTSAQTAIPSMKALMLDALAETKMLSGKRLEQAIAFVQNMEDAPTLLHGDFTFSNLILSLDTDKAYWIDLGRATHGLPMFDLGHFWLFCNLFGKKQRVQDIAHMTDKQMVQFWNTFALAYNGPDNLEAFNAECKRFAALDVILLGHIQTLNWHERLFLGLLVKSLMK